MTREGGCLCGAVRYVALDVPDVANVCHCRMCQKWTGSSFVEVSVPEDRVTWTGREHIRVYTSSEWGERAFCGLCGSSLYFRMTEESVWSGNYDLALGTFDDTSGFRLGAEIFIDQKPDLYALTDKGQKRLTRADCVAAFPRLDATQA